MRDFLQAFGELVRVSDVQFDVLTSAAIVLLLWLGRRIVLYIAYRRFDDVHVRYRWRKVSAYAVFVLGAFLVARIWIEGVVSLATYLGLLTAGLTIALSDLVSNLAGWIFIVSRQPFRLGDRIQIGDQAGDVIDIRPFQFSLMEIGNWVDAEQSTGRVIHVPNGKVLREPVANYSGGFPYIWNEIPVLVTFESNWEKAKQLLLDIEARQASHVTEQARDRIREASKKFLIFYSKLGATVYTSVRDSGVLLTLRYLCDIRQRRGTEQSIWEDVLREFAACDDIDFAYPTTRFYDNYREGKAGTRAGPSGSRGTTAPSSDARGAATPSDRDAPAPD